MTPIILYSILPYSHTPISHIPILPYFHTPILSVVFKAISPACFPVLNNKSSIDRLGKNPVFSSNTCRYFTGFQRYNFLAGRCFAGHPRHRLRKESAFSVNQILQPFQFFFHPVQTMQIPFASRPIWRFKNVIKFIHIIFKKGGTVIGRMNGFKMPGLPFFCVRNQHFIHWQPLVSAIQQGH